MSQIDLDALEKPRRVQLSRVKGWRMPENTVKVDRTTRFGNPFRVGDFLLVFGGANGPIQAINKTTAAQTVAAFRASLLVEGAEPMRQNIRARLGGKNLACWCRLDQPCHADVLLEIANDPAFLARNGESK